MDIPTSTKRAKSPGVSSRLYEPTAASRSRAAAINTAASESVHHPTNEPRPFTSRPSAAAAAVPLSLRGLGGAHSGSSRATSPSATHRGPLAVASRRGAGANIAAYDANASVVSAHLQDQRHASSSDVNASSHTPSGGMRPEDGDVVPLMGASSLGAALAGTRRTPVRARKATPTATHVVSAPSAAPAGRYATPTASSRRSAGTASAAPAPSSSVSGRLGTPSRTVTPRSGVNVAAKRATATSVQQQHHEALSPSHDAGMMEVSEVIMSPGGDTPVARRQATGGDVPKTPSPARFASRSPPRTSATKRSDSTSTAQRKQPSTLGVGINTSTPSSRTARASSVAPKSSGTAAKRSGTPAATTTTRRAVSPSASASPQQRETPKKVLKKKKSAVDADTTLTGISPLRRNKDTLFDDAENGGVVEMSPVTAAPPVALSPEEQAALLLRNLEEVVSDEDNARTDIRVEEDVSLWREYTALLTEHAAVLDSKIADYHIREEVERKRELCEEMKAQTAKAQEEIIYYRLATEDIKLEVRENKELEKKLNALVNFSKINEATMRQKQATMEFLQNTTKELASSCDLLIARLYVEVEALSDLALACRKRDSFSDSHHAKPIECMAVLAETDLLREIHLEEQVKSAEASQAESAQVNEDMKVILREGQEALVVKADEMEQEKAVLKRKWLSEKKFLERDAKALKKEITDLNFQIRRGTNIKSLSQLPTASNHQIDRNRARELYLDVEDQRLALENVRKEETALRERLLTLRQYHNNKEEDCTAMVTKAIKEREQLEAIKDSLREDVVRLQRGALTYHDRAAAQSTDGRYSQQYITDGPTTHQGGGEGFSGLVVDEHVADTAESPLPTSGPNNNLTSSRTSASALDDIDDEETDTYQRRSDQMQQRASSSNPTPPRNVATTTSAAVAPAMAVLTADEALRILADMEADDKARAHRRTNPQKNHHDPNGHNLSYFSNVTNTSYATNSSVVAVGGVRADGHDSFYGNSSYHKQFVAHPAPRLRGRSKTPTAGRTTKPSTSSVLDRLCKPTTAFASYVDVRVNEDNARRSTQMQLSEARPDARR